VNSGCSRADIASKRMPGFHSEVLLNKFLFNRVGDRSSILSSLTVRYPVVGIALANSSSESNNRVLLLSFLDAVQVVFDAGFDGLPQ
jgi:hypothetical protein